MTEIENHILIISIILLLLLIWGLWITASIYKIKERLHKIEDAMYVSLRIEIHRAGIRKFETRIPLQEVPERISNIEKHLGLKWEEESITPAGYKKIESEEK